ncbi:EpsG family protein [Paracoccus sp. SJTW-4]|uniref:EpsG family protein n=1 Tax=Paracoccus sp. SJTW-4 TaxID=3078428 RepID=UPI0039ED4F8F
MTYVAMAFGLFLLRYAVLGQPRLNRQLYPIVLAILFLFSGFRFEVGCDWGGYLNQYELARSMTRDQALQNVEPVWWSLLRLQYMIGLPYPWINVLSSLVCFAGIHVLARRQPDPLGFLVLLFPVLLINMPMSGIRQGAAIGLICVAMTRFMNGRLLGFLLWVVLAASFHSSAAIFLLLAPLVSRKITGVRILGAALLALPGVVLLMAGEAGQVATQRYIDTGRDAFGGPLRIALLSLSSMFFFLFLRKAWRREFPEDYQFVTLGAVGMMLIAALLPVSTIIADRLGYYFIPLQALIFARIPWMQSLPSRPILAAAPYLGLLVFFVVWTMSSGHFQSCYIPYQSWILGAP